MGSTTATSTSRHPAQVPTYRLRLNDYLQQRRRHTKVRWVDYSTGRQERPQWTVTCYLNDVAYGTGRGPTKSEAKELAAKQTLELLHQPQVPTWGVDPFKWTGEGSGDHHSYAYLATPAATAYAPVTHPYIATPGTPASGLQALPTTSASPSHYAYPSQYQGYHYQPYYHTQHAPQQPAYYVYSSSDPYYRH